MSPRRSPERARLMFALLLSLLIHLLLLRLTFGGQGLWLPGFSFPWQVRRIAVHDLRVVLVPARIAAAEPLQQAWVEQTVSSGPSRTPSVSGAPTKGRLAAARAQETNPSVEARPVTAADPGTNATIDAAPAPARLDVDKPGDPAPPPIPAPAVIDLPRTDEAELVVPATPQTVVPSQVVDAGDAARAGEQLEVARPEDARQEAARAESARLETEHQETVRIEAARAEAARVEAARVEAARVEAVRVVAARVEAARIEVARLEAERQKAAKIEAARVEVEQEAARRDAVRRALGRQLDEEADRRDAAKAAARLSPSYSAARRYRLFGRTDPNSEIILYAEAWSRKIQMNMTLDMVREAAKENHTDPLVTVAIRSDGSVESVTFVRSSGVAAIDEAIRRIVESQAPYRVFPPGLANEYDVIEIRRSWHFDIAVRLY